MGYCYVCRDNCSITIHHPFITDAEDLKDFAQFIHQNWNIVQDYPKYDDITCPKCCRSAFLKDKKELEQFVETKKKKTKK